MANRSAIGCASRDAVLRVAAAAIAGSASWSDCWTAGSARIDLRPWQLEPARAAIAGASRLLLADAVGLGKTIQAGLILAELMARGLAQRILILTPASLRAQWASELSAKFGLVAAVFDHSALAEAAANLPVGVNPWKTASIVVSSIDLVKRPEVRSALDEVPFDALVVDEAHHLTPGTDRSAVVVDLAGRTPWVVLATATPHSGDEAAYRFLHSIGAHAERPAARHILPTSNRSRRWTASARFAARRPTHQRRTPSPRCNVAISAGASHQRWRSGSAPRRNRDCTSCRLTRDRGASDVRAAVGSHEGSTTRDSGAPAVGRR